MTMLQEPSTQVCESTITEGGRTSATVMDVSPDLATSPTLQRLLEEVRNTEQTPYLANYNRSHNRHNRG
jgi:hypothetical protein